MSKVSQILSWGLFFLLWLIHLVHSWKHNSPSNQITFFYSHWSPASYNSACQMIWFFLATSGDLEWGNYFVHHYHRKLEVHQTQHAVGGADLQFEKDSICAPSAQLGGRPRITRSPLFVPLLIWANERKYESKFVKQRYMNSASFSDSCSSHRS